MIVLSLVLVIVAAVTLVLGVFQDGLMFIYVSIGTCLAAMVLLGIGVLMRRREESEPTPASTAYGTRPEPAGADTARSTGEAARDESVQVRQTADTEQLRETTPQRTAGAAEVRPAKKAVVKKAAARGEAGDRPPSPFEARGESPPAATSAGATAGGDRPEAAETSEASGATATAAASGAAAGGAASDTTATKTAKKSAAKKSTKKAAASKTAKKSAAKKTAKKATAKKAAKKSAAKKTAKKAAKKSAAKKSAAKKATAKKSAAKKSAAKKAAKRSGGSRSASLPEIKGLGPTKADALLERFGSVEALRDADVSEISDVKGVGEGLARQIKRELGG